LSSGEPVVVVTKGRDAVRPRELRLREAYLRGAQVAEAQISWKVRLIVPTEQRTRFGDVGPLGESSSPPRVVFRNRVELREVKRDGARGGAQRVPPSVATAFTTS